MPLSTDEDLLLKVIDEAAAAAEKKILREKRLSYEEAIPLLLKSQYRRLVHLEDGVEQLRTDMNQGFSDMDKRFVQFREEVTTEIGSLRQEMHDNIGDLRQDMYNNIGSLRQDMYDKIENLRQDVYDKIATQTRWMVGTMIAMTGIFGGLLALFKIF